MKYFIIAITLLCMFASCKKENQYSTWTVNGESFSTNETKVTETERQRVSDLSGGELENRFSLQFRSGTLPEAGRFMIRQEFLYDQPEVNVGFFYNSKGYQVSLFEVKYIEASSVNGKASYHLPPTWFVNYEDTNDSVLVEGLFKVP